MFHEFITSTMVLIWSSLDFDYWWRISKFLQSIWCTSTKPVSTPILSTICSWQWKQRIWVFLTLLKRQETPHPPRLLLNHIQQKQFPFGLDAIPVNHPTINLFHGIRYKYWWRHRRPKLSFETKTYLPKDNLHFILWLWLLQLKPMTK